MSVKRILLFPENVRYGAIIARALQAEGFLVVQVRMPAEFQAAIRDEPAFDLIICGMALPTGSEFDAESSHDGMATGKLLMLWLRSPDGGNCNAPFLALTNSGEGEVSRLGLTPTGLHDRLVHAFEVQTSDLIAIVREMLAKK